MIKILEKIFLKTGFWECCQIDPKLLELTCFLDFPVTSMEQILLITLLWANQSFRSPRDKCPYFNLKSLKHGEIYFLFGIFRGMIFILIQILKVWAVRKVSCLTWYQNLVWEEVLGLRPLSPIWIPTCWFESPWRAEFWFFWLSMCGYEAGSEGGC